MLFGVADLAVTALGAPLFGAASAVWGAEITMESQRTIASELTALGGWLFASAALDEQENDRQRNEEPLQRENEAQKREHTREDTVVVQKPSAACYSWIIQSISNANSTRHFFCANEHTPIYHATRSKR